MSRIRATVLALPLAILPGAVLACADRDAAVAAVEARDFETAAALREAIDISPDCDDAFRDWLSERLAEESFRVAMFEATSLPERKALLERSLGYYEHWRTYEALADIAAAEGDRTAEATSLQKAIDRLNEGPARHEATEDEIQDLFERATVAVRLADGVVPETRTRSGEAGGIFSKDIRGFVVHEVPLPITYKFDSTEFTPDGEAYARQLLDHLTATHPAHIGLVGHTDPSGAEDYNMDLSLRRAEALRDFLKRNGFTGEIDITGRGESEIPNPPEGIEEGSEEHYRLARRVVLQRG